MLLLPRIDVLFSDFGDGKIAIKLQFKCPLKAPLSPVRILFNANVECPNIGAKQWKFAIVFVCVHLFFPDRFFAINSLH